MEQDPKNPYTTPKAPVENLQTQEKKGSGVKAVLIGLIVDIAGSMAAGLSITFVWGVYLAMGGMSPEEMSDYFTTGTAYLMVNLICGSLFTALGGYVAATIANHQEYKYAFLVGLGSLIFGEVMISMAKDYSIWLRIAGDFIVIPVALYGGHLRVRAKYKQSQAR